MEELKKPYIEGFTTEIKLYDKNITLAMDRIEGTVKLYEFVKKIGEEMGLELPERHSGGSGDAGTFATMGRLT